jgi:hypothetical protein
MLSIERMIASKMMLSTEMIERMIASKMML